MGIYLTEKAASKLKRVFEVHGLPETACLRVSTVGCGCSGYSYSLDVATEPNAMDQVTDTQGVRVICDPDSAQLLDGTEIDYDDTILRTGFVFRNPNAGESCECGGSFSP